MIVYEIKMLNELCELGSRQHRKRQAVAHQLVDQKSSYAAVSILKRVDERYATYAALTPLTFRNAIRDKRLHT